MEQRTIDSVIKEKAVSVNKLFETNKFSVSLQHLYRVVNGEVSTSLTVANELATALGLDLVDVHNLLVKAKKEHAIQSQ